MALTTGDLAQLKAAYENMNVYNTPMVDNMSVYENVAPLNVNVPSGLQTIDIQPVTEAQSVTQSNGLDYLLNQEGGQNQNFTMKEYEKALANPNAKPQSNNFFSGIFSNVMNNKYVQGARNIGSMITDPFMGGLSYLAQKADKFSSLPYVNQQFIKENMGYTGPTVFGENTSGLSTDPFGINTRSLRGDYAEFVGKESTKLDAAVEKATAKYENKINPQTGKNYTRAQIAKQLSSLLKRQSFYGDKNLDFSKKKQAYDKTIEIKEADRKIRKAAAQQEIIRKAAAEGIAQGKAYDYEGRDTPYGIHTSTISAPKALTNRESQRGNGGNQGKSDADHAQAGGSGMHGGRHYQRGGIVTL